jgi:hypothetical protein
MDRPNIAILSKSSTLKLRDLKIAKNIYLISIIVAIHKNNDQYFDNSSILWYACSNYTSRYDSTAICSKRRMRHLDVHSKLRFRL